MKRQRRAPTDRPTRRRSCVDLQRRRSGWRPVWQQCCSHALHPSDSRRDEPRIRGKSHIDVGEWRQLEAKPDWTRRDCIRTRWGVSLPLYFVNYIHVDCLQLRLDDSQVSWKSNVNHTDNSSNSITSICCCFVALQLVLRHPVQIFVQISSDRYWIDAIFGLNGKISSRYRMTSQNGDAPSEIFHPKRSILFNPDFWRILQIMLHRVVKFPDNRFKDVGQSRYMGAQRRNWRKL